MNNEYKIRYLSLEPIVFKKKDRIEEYIRGEIQIWTPFFKSLENDGLFKEIQIDYATTTNAEQLSGALDELLRLTSDVQGFNSRTEWQRGISPPPPSSSLEGRLILALFGGGHAYEAKAVYLHFLCGSAKAHGNLTPDFTRAIQTGLALKRSAIVTSVLPFQNTTQAVVKKIAEAQEVVLHNLNEQSITFGDALAEHEKTKNELRARLIRRFARFGREAVLREKRRTATFDQWLESKDKTVEEELNQAEKRLRLLDMKIGKQLAQRKKEHDDLLELLFDKLKFEAPVKLWEKRAVLHKRNAEKSLKLFYILCAVTIIVGVSTPVFFGDYIASSFRESKCIPQLPEVCVSSFSAKGPLMVGGILIASSVLLWLVRLQHRVHLSERHLFLDATEKSAFAEAYLAMRQGNDVDKQNEAIVLQSLFRPTQDGIVNDNEGVLDISAAAILARQLGRQ